MDAVSSATTEQRAVPERAAGGQPVETWGDFVRRLFFYWPIELRKPPRGTRVPWIRNAWTAAAFGAVTGGVLAPVAWVSHREALARYGLVFLLQAAVLAPVSLGTHLSLPYLVNEAFSTLRRGAAIGKNIPSGHYNSFKDFSDRLKKNLNRRVLGILCLILSVLYVPYRFFLTPIWSANPSGSEWFWAILAYCVEALAVYWGVLSIIRIVIITVFVSKLMRFFRVHVQPLHPDGCGGLQQIGHLFIRLVQLAALIGLAAVGMAIAMGNILVDPFHRFEWWVLALIYLVDLPMLVIVFLLVPHNVMVGCRSDVVIPLAKRFASRVRKARLAPGQTLEDLAANTKSLSEIANQIRTINEAYPVWPIQILPLQRVAVTALLPILIPILSSIVIRLISGVSA